MSTRPHGDGAAIFDDVRRWTTLTSVQTCTALTTANASIVPYIELLIVFAHHYTILAAIGLRSASPAFSLHILKGIPSTHFQRHEFRTDPWLTQRHM
jgi:hypothetical protein